MNASCVTIAANTAADRKEDAFTVRSTGSDTSSTRRRDGLTQHCANALHVFVGESKL
jgi:hypothetical protein